MAGISTGKCLFRNAFVARSERDDDEGLQEPRGLHRALNARLSPAKRARGRKGYSTITATQSVIKTRCPEGLMFPPDCAEFLPGTNSNRVRLGYSRDLYPAWLGSRFYLPRRSDMWRNVIRKEAPNNLLGGEAILIP